MARLPLDIPAAQLAVGLAIAGLIGAVTTQNAIAQATLTGPTQQWQTLDLTFALPGTFDEKAGPNNPFLDYRLQVEFKQGNQTYSVPGYYAGNDNSGNGLWRVHFTPDTAGDWTYTSDFRTGNNAAVLLDAEVAAAPGLTTTAQHNQTGAFTAAAFDPSAPGFASKGRLRYTGGHYLQFGDGSYWLKSGMDSPENLLGYRGFDNTQTQGLVQINGNRLQGNLGILHNFAPHAQDYNPGDPGWNAVDFNGNPVTVPNTPAGSGDAGNLIGAANYLSSVGVNSIYFLVNNIGGDAKDVHPYANLSTPEQLSGEFNTGVANDNLRFDNSKLAQWEQFFTHAQEKGLHLHVVLNERELANKSELDDATLGIERKLYYREMVARFGHHNSLQWNISEEYDFAGRDGGFGSTEAEEAQAVIDFAAYLSAVDPYNSPLTVHNAQKANIDTDPANSAWQYFIGEDDFDLTSLQRAEESEGWSDTVENFRDATAAAGRPIAIMIDEPESITRIALGPNENPNASDQDFQRFTTVRKTMTWDIFLSGGAGVEWFVHNGDQSIENFRPFEKVFLETAIARRFVEENLPFWAMTPDDDLVRYEDEDYGGAEVFFKDGEVYAIYLPDGSNEDGPGGIAPQLDLRDHAGVEFLLRWYNPRTGEFDDQTAILTGGDWASLGATPSGFNNVADWTALVTVIPEPTTGLSLGLCSLGLFAGPSRGRRRL
ncbi:MAG: DUF5060 domain-containing protein [Planctomycetota bacterium]